ncbi:ATP-binding cassette subfamily C (plasmid) [Azospirillum sp. B510]|nr:ATP-binding cassette subfamily C [Azospirillum sp. B510]
MARMARAPGEAVQLLAVSALLAVLGLAVSLFVIQVLNRYVTHGVSGTLLTLTAGAVLAVAAEHQLRKLRWVIAEAIAGDQDRRLATGVFGLTLTADLRAQAAWSPAAREELVRGTERARAAFGPAGLTTIADLPFSLMVLAVLALLSPTLAVVTGGFCAGLALLAWIDQRRLAAPAAAMNRATGEVNALVAAAVHAAETVRHFRAHAALMERWRILAEQARLTGERVGWLHLHGASLTQATQGLLSIAVIAVGGMQVVAGTLDVGTLVGANLIAGRVLSPFGRIVQYGRTLRTAAAALAEARRFAGVAVERAGGRTLADWTGGLTLSGVAASFPGREEPVFSGLDVTVEPGGVVVLTGRNGSGKSTLLKLLAGLIEPSRGQVLANGADLRVLSLDWWRSQVSYLPQEPLFLPGTLRDNLRLARPDATDADLLRALAEADLADLVNRHPRHLDLVLEDGGRTLAPGIRRRLGLARALVTDGPLYLLDEPTEGLDREGAQLVYQRLIALARRGRTLIIASHDPVILNGARCIVRLDGAASGVQPPVPMPMPATVRAAQ